MLRHITNDNAYDFERELETAEKEITETGETFIQIEHAVGSHTVNHYDSDEMVLVFSCVIYSLPIRYGETSHLRPIAPSPKQAAEKRREDMGDPHDYVGEP